MNKIKKYSKCIGITLGLILIFSFFLNTLNYFNLININIYKLLLIIMSSISIFTGAYILGKQTQHNGYIEGLKYGIITTLLFYIISFLAFNQNINISNLLYYLIVITISIIGSMIGINKKEDNPKEKSL